MKTKTIVIILVLGIVMCLAFYAGFSIRTPYDNSGEVILRGIFEVPGTTAWQVIYEYNGQEYSQIFKTRIQAESWIR